MKKEKEMKRKQQRSSWHSEAERVLDNSPRYSSSVLLSFVRKYCGLGKKKD